MPQRFRPSAATTARRVLLLILATVGAAVHARQDCDINGQPVNPANGATTAGRSGLMRCKDSDTGLLQREQEVRDGRFVGLERFYKQGKLAKEYTVNDKGNVQGRLREFDLQGQVLHEANYDNGSARGLSLRFHPDGKLRRAEFFGADRTAGASAEFNAHGQLSELRCGPVAQLAPAVDDAKLCGFAQGASEVELFDARGLLRARTRWLDGQRVRFVQLDDQGRARALEEVDGARRAETVFFADGQKRLARERTMNGREVAAERLLQYAESGSLAREQRWEKGRPVIDRQYHLNGQPRKLVEWRPTPDGVLMDETDYRDDGQVSARAGWLEREGRRQPVGKHVSFHATGRPASETEFDERGRPRREKAWSEAGALVRDDAVFADGSRKAFAR